MSGRALVLVLLIYIFGSNEHVSGKVIVTTEAGAPFGSNGIGIGEFSYSTNGQVALLRGFDLVGCDLKSGNDYRRYALSISDNFGQRVLQWDRSLGLPNIYDSKVLSRLR